jgi:UDP-N-acetylglucosamine 2-epimerase (non-hydrolysing)
MGRLGFAPGSGLHLLDPLGYLDFLGLMDSARFVLTDSGGIQEETTALGVPCLTLRANTERPITITEGTNRLLGTDAGGILPAAEEILGGPPIPPRCPALWDGKAGERIAGVISRYLGGG